MTAEATAADLHILVRNEVDRLPAKYREPVRLCYFEGRTHDGAAAVLGWPVGTVRGRLSRARALLRTRLGRRGIGITPASLVAALAGSGDARAEIPRLLRETTLAAAARDASVAAAVTALAVGVARGLVAVAVVKAVVVALLVVSLVAAGAGIAVFAGRNEPRQGKPVPNADRAEARTPAVDRYGDPLPRGAIARLGTVRFRQSLLDGSTYLSRVLFSPDGRSLVTVGRQGGVSIWESGSGRLVRSINATEAAIAPDGKSLATARTGLVQLWDFADGRERHTASPNPQEQFNQLAFSPDGSILVAIGVVRDESERKAPAVALVAWNTSGFAERFRSSGDFRHTRALAFAPDGKTLALATPDRKWTPMDLSNPMTEPDRAWIQLLDAADESETRRIYVEKFDIGSVAFSPDGRTLAAGVGDRTIRLFDLATGAERLPRFNREHARPTPKWDEIVSKGYDEGARSMGALAFSPDGSLLASGLEAIGYWNGGGTELVPIVLWDVAGRREVRRFPGHTSGIWSVAFSPDGRTLASAGSDPVARLWDVATGREVDPRPGHRGEYTLLAVSPADGTIFTGGSWDHVVLRWEPVTGRCLGTVAEVPTAILSLAVSPDGRSLLIDTWDGLLLWDVAAQREIRRFSDKRLAHTGFYQAAFSPDGRTMTMEHRVWETATGRLLTSFPPPADDRPVSTHYLSARYTPDGRRLVSFETRGVRVLDIASGAEVGRPIRAEIPDPTRGVISPDGRLVTPGNYVSSTGSGKGRRGTDLAIRIYELASGKEVAVLKGCTDQVSALAFCPDGRTLATAGGNLRHARDRTVRVWDITSGRELRRFDNHPGGATAIAYLPDGRSLVTIGMDGVALVWDVSDLVDRRPHERSDPNPAR